MQAQFAHYWKEGVILTEEERDHQRQIMKAMNQGFVFTVPEGSRLNGKVYTTRTTRELREMMMRECGAPSDMIPLLLEDEDPDETDEPIPDREPSESEPAVFLTQADQDATYLFVFFH